MIEKKPILPIIKWAGGKKRIATVITDKIASFSIGTYFEPFLGGGAIMFSLLPSKAVGIDSNSELINMYQVVKEHPKELIESLKKEFVPFHNPDFFYQVRAWDREDCYLNRPAVQRAARLIYLNRTCYNGLWRVNKTGYNNVPIGMTPSPKILFEDRIIEMNKYFNEHEVIFINSDYQNVENYATAGDFVYFDPPYHAEKGKSEFTSYTSIGFSESDQIILKALCDRLIKKGVNVAVSNSKSDFIMNLYRSNEYHIYEIIDDVSTSRVISSNIKSRGKSPELLIVGYLNGKNG